MWLPQIGLELPKRLQLGEHASINRRFYPTTSCFMHWRSLSIQGTLTRFSVVFGNATFGENQLVR